jgi:hypothetical protein
MVLLRGLAKGVLERLAVVRGFNLEEGDEVFFFGFYHKIELYRDDNREESTLSLRAISFAHNAVYPTLNKEELVEHLHAFILKIQKHQIAEIESKEKSDLQLFVRKILNFLERELSIEMENQFPESA